MTLELDIHDKLLLSEIISNLLWNSEQDEDGGYFASPAYRLSDREYEQLQKIQDKL